MTLVEGSNVSRLEARLRLRVAVKSRAGHGSLRNGARFITAITTGCLVAASVLPAILISQDGCEDSCADTYEPLLSALHRGDA